MHRGRILQAIVRLVVELLGVVVALLPDGLQTLGPLLLLQPGLGESVELRQPQPRRPRRQGGQTRPGPGPRAPAGHRGREGDADILRPRVSGQLPECVDRGTEDVRERFPRHHGLGGHGHQRGAAGEGGRHAGLEVGGRVLAVAVPRRPLAQQGRALDASQADQRAVWCLLLT